MKTNVLSTLKSCDLSSVSGNITSTSATYIKCHKQSIYEELNLTHAADLSLAQILKRFYKLFHCLALSYGIMLPLT